MRVVAKHDWPALRVTAATAAPTAASRSASGSTTVGDLPPSSRLTGTIRRAAAAITADPPATEPVNVTCATCGWSTTAAPVVSPRPTTTLQAPRGSPAASNASATTSVDSGATSDGLTTTVLPAASDGATPRTICDSGEFHGVMCATTPSGSRSV